VGLTLSGYWDLDNYLVLRDGIMSSNNNDFTGWAIVEIMGHQKYAGHVSTQAIGGASMVRVDVPEIEGHAAFTKLFGASSIYCMTPVDELVAKAMAKSLRKAPVDIYEFPKEVIEAMRTAKLPAPKQTELEFNDEFHDDSDEPY
jgi:hypothetical protein